MINNILELLLVAGAYLFLFMLLPFWVMGYRLTQEKVMDKLVSSLVVGNVIVISSVLLLSLAGIYNRIVILALFAILICAYRFFIKRNQTIAFLKRAEENFIMIKEGYYIHKMLGKNIKSKIHFFLMQILRKTGNPVNLIIILMFFGFAIYMRSYNAVVNMYYGASDMYLHTEWIKYIDVNKPFIGGIYPFGMHAAVSSLGMVFGFDVLTVMRMIGSIMGILIVFILYYALKRVFKSNLAVNIAMIFYCILNVYNPMAIERQVLALPQEYGMIFLYLSGIYMHDYMKNKEIKSLIYFAGAVSITIMAHFFITIYALVLCFSIFITHLVFMNRKVFVRLIAGAMCALIIAVLPMGIAFAKGTKLQNSLYWALGMLEFQQVQESEVTVEDLRENRAKQIERLKDPLGTLKNIGFFGTETNNLACMKYEWFLIYIFTAIFGLVFPIFKFKGRERQWIVMAFCLYSLFTLGLRLMPIFGFKGVMEPHRMLMFLIYSVPFALGVPFELMYNLGQRFGKASLIAYTIFVALTGGAFAYYIIDGPNYGFFCRVGQMQYNGAVKAYYKITKEFEDHKWTIISTTDEYSLCLNKGYHAELSEFIIYMNNYSPKREYTIPTEQVFIYVDKRPHRYSGAVNMSRLPQPAPELDIADAELPIDDIIAENKKNVLYFYKNLPATRILQAKAYAWAEEYRKYFPNEMEVYYEDDEVIIYRLQQNPYALYNLSIPYLGNRWGEPLKDDVEGEDGA